MSNSDFQNFVGKYNEMLDRVHEAVSIYLQALNDNVPKRFQDRFPNMFHFDETEDDVVTIKEDGIEIIREECSSDHDLRQCSFTVYEDWITDDHDQNVMNIQSWIRDWVEKLELQEKDIKEQMMK